MSRFRLALSGALAVAAAALAVRGQNSPDLAMLPIDHPAIQYAQGPLDDPVARLDKQLASGTIKLEFRSGRLGYPLSYIVYSAAFDAMPDVTRERVYHRLYDILTDKDQSEKFARLSSEDRRAVLEILRETITNLPAYWTAESPR